MFVKIKREKTQAVHKSSRILITILFPQIILLAFVLFSSIILLGFISEYSNDINAIGKIRGGMQRYVKLKVMHQENGLLFETLEQNIDNNTEFEVRHRFLFSNKDIEASRELHRLLLKLDETEKPGVTDGYNLYVLSEDAWYKADTITAEIEYKTHKFIQVFIFITFLIFPTMIILIIVLFIVKNKIEHGVEYQASRDKLTGLYNRNFLDEIYNSYIKKHTDDIICILLCDVDHFKTINDRYGHTAGDEVLRGLSTILNKTCRDDDYIFRYGGEEFVILSSVGTPEKTGFLAERLRDSVENTPIAGIKLTISIGVSANRGNCDLATRIRHSDEALYAAKNSGRNSTRIKNGCS